jgi:flavin reductase ActVB
MADSVDQMAFRNAMASFASGVTVVTTRDKAGRDTGFTASAFSSLSLEPPLVLVCLQKDADCYPAFMKADSFGVSILSSEQPEIAVRFATKAADKLNGTPIVRGAKSGIALIAGASAHVECLMHDRVDEGDHTILVGRAVSAVVNGTDPLLHYNRQFGRFVAEDGA